jgi:LysR family transcriptional regulator, nitrogen assimilation regulatory protein
MSETMRLGTSFMAGPPSSVKPELDGGELVGAPVRGLKVTPGLFWHRERPMMRTVQELAHVVQDEASALLKRQPKIF